MSKISKLFSKFNKNKKSDDLDLDENDQLDINSDDLTSTPLNNVFDDTGDYTSDINLDDKLSFKDQLEILLIKMKDSFNKLRGNKFNSIGQKSEQTINIEAFNLSQIYKTVFDSSNRTIINKTFLTLMLLSFLYILGFSIGNLLKDKKHYSKTNNNSLNLDDSKVLTKESINSIKRSSVFKTEKIKQDTIATPIKKTELICNEASQDTRLPIKLINTIVLQDSIKSIASVQIRNSELQNVREGDKIDSIAEVGKIDRMGIVIKNLRDGTCEKVASSNISPKRSSNISVLSPSQSKIYKQQKKSIDGIENNGNSFNIKKSFLEEKMSDISNVLTQAKGTPIPNPDGSMSFKITDIEPGGIFSYLGIQDNDIITQINGSKIEDLNQVMNLFGRITNIDQLTITVTRDGQEVPLDYKFK